MKQRPGERAFSFGLVQNPDVPELGRHPVLLKLDGAGRCLPKLGCIEDHGAERMILVQNLAVQQQRHDRVGSLLTGRVESWSLEVDVEGLPFKYRARGANPRLGRDGVIELTVRIGGKAAVCLIDVSFISILKVHTAVGGPSNRPELRSEERRVG